MTASEEFTMLTTPGSRTEDRAAAAQNEVKECLEEVLGVSLAGVGVDALRAEARAWRARWP